MKTISQFGLYGLFAGAAILAGCSTPTIMVDYVQPARKVADVSKVDVVTVKVEANINGNMAGEKAMNEALVRQMLSARLYKSGYYHVMDDLWGDADGAAKIGQLLAKAVDAGHMYSSYTVGDVIPDSEKCPNCGEVCTKCKELHKGLKAKAELEVTINLDLNTNETVEEKEFELVTMPYVPVQVKAGLPPTSAPNPVAAQQTKQKVETKVFKTVATGTVTARFNGIDGAESPVAYSNTFTLPIAKVEPKVDAPKNDSFMGAMKAAATEALAKKEEKILTELGSPSQLEVLAEVLSPAIAEIVSDISPYTETRELVAIEGGDKRVVTLLNAQAFRETVDFVSELARSGAAVSADLENMGIALEAMGQFELALKTFKKAVKLNPENPSVTAQASVARVEKVLAGNKAIEASGAKKDADAQFKNAK